MIKLNNKNITYVALADSNNSIKAPKEIWYADTNNSVKLVYRRKDALIDGEDYEKYNWLKGDGTAYISHPDIDDFEIKTYSIDNTKVIYERGYRVGEPSQEVILHLGYGAALNFYSSLIISRLSGGAYANFRTNEISYGEHIIRKTSISENIGIFTDNVRHKKNSITDLDYIGTEYVFNRLIPDFSTYIGYLSCTQIHLIPCKLLKPVPKWLDANGIRRQVGECGMIDLVSGKFYGNVNSVGTFTVENYYERKEWLVAQTTEKVTMMALPLHTSDFKYSLHLLDSVPNLSYFTSSWHTYGVTDTQTLVFIYDRKNSTRVYSCQTGFQLGDIIVIDSTAEDLLFNNISIPKYGFPAENFIIQTNNNVALNMRVSSITIDGKERYIPCTLTMDLPASMDANNIARTKGTSGMWDLVSDRFYGNVANSGTFKAVNLAEGVDYEVHQWLVGDGSAYINTLITKFDGVVDISFYFSSYTGNIFGRERRDSSIEDYSDRFVVTVTNTTPNCRIYGKNNNDAGLSIANDERLIIDIDNGVATNKNGDTVTISVMANVTGRNLYLFADNYRGKPYSNKFNGRIGLFSISNKIYLIPVKLLRSIPSKYDANGIARQAGECGMYDTVNDVFYGNVASSGTFSVSDD